MVRTVILVVVVASQAAHSERSTDVGVIDAELQKRLHETTAVAEAILCANETQPLKRLPPRCNKAAKWWNFMGNSGQVREEIALLHDVASSARVSTGKAVRTVCEVGFNAGHAAVAMMHGLETHLVEFDLLSLPYSQAAKAALEAAYPGRTRFYEGRSQLTIPQYAAHVASRPGTHKPCDMWMVDGDHWKGALLDMRAAVNASRDGAAIVADDCSARHPDVLKAWQTMVADGLIREDFRKEVVLPPPAGNKGWCVGRAVRREGDHAQLSRGFEVANRLMIDPVSRSGFMAREAARKRADAAATPRSR